MYFRTLGNFDLSHEGRLLTPTAPKQRSVLALLAIHRGRIVPISALVEEIWPTDLPTSAVTTLQTYIYQIRRLLAEAVGEQNNILVTKPFGYLVDVGPNDIDVHRFSRMVELAKRSLADGEPEKASELLHTANGMWTGEVLCDVHRGPLLEAHAARINEAGLQALELQAETDLQLGRHHEVVGELRGLVSKHPWHEGLNGKLITALYRCDQRSQALEIYHELRRSLNDELGIDPSPTLQRLYQGVLTDAPQLSETPRSRATLGSPPPRPAQLPADLGDFTCRTAELASLDQLLVPDAGTPGLLAVTGMPGVGKTALVVRAAHAAQSRFADAQLWADLGGSTDRPATTAATLRGFLHALEPSAEQLPDDPEELGRMFRSRVADMAGLLVLDDARSAEQVRLLLPGGSGWKVLVTGRRLTGPLPGAYHMVLDPLSVEDGINMLAGMVGPRGVLKDIGALGGVVRRCGGLPLALRALGERLTVNRHWSIGKLARRMAEPHGMLAELNAADPGLVDHLRRSFDDLAAADGEALGALARAGLEAFDLTTAAAVVACDEWTTEDVLDRLVAAHTLRITPPSPGHSPRYLLHPLLQAVLRASPAAALSLAPQGEGVR